MKSLDPRPLARTLHAFAALVLGTLGAACGPTTPPALPDLPPPEYEPARRLDLAPHASATGPVAPPPAVAPPAIAPPAVAPPAPKR